MNKEPIMECFPLLRRKEEETYLQGLNNPFSMQMPHPMFQNPMLIHMPHSMFQNPMLMHMPHSMPQNPMQMQLSMYSNPMKMMSMGPNPKKMQQSLFPILKIQDLRRGVIQV